MTRPVAFLAAALLWLQTGDLAAEAPRDSPCAQAPAPAADARVNLNTATEAELVNLPGIGPSRARAILDFRAQHGGFRSVSQLLRIKGIGRAMLKRLKPLVFVDGS